VHLVEEEDGAPALLPEQATGPSTTSRTSFTPAVTAESGTNCLAVAVATTDASVVLPVPGAPQDGESAGPTR